jgi:hypothetical protein
MNEATTILTCADLKQETNALGHVARFTQQAR